MDNSFGNKTLYEVMLDHPNRLANKAFQQLAYDTVAQDILTIEHELERSLVEERSRLDRESKKWKFMSQSNVEKSVSYLRGVIRSNYSEILNS